MGPDHTTKSVTGIPDGFVYFALGYGGGIVWSHVSIFP